MMFHDRKMNGVTRRQLAVPKDDFLCTLGYVLIDRQHLIDDIE